MVTGTGAEQKEKKSEAMEGGCNGNGGGSDGGGRGEYMDDTGEFMTHHETEMLKIKSRLMCKLL